MKKEKNNVKQLLNKSLPFSFRQRRRTKPTQQAVPTQIMSAKAFLKILLDRWLKPSGNEKNTTKYMLSKHIHYRSALANGKE